MLSSIPIEILDIIYLSLSRIELAKLSQTCKAMYKTTLPRLYSHLEISKHVHVRQLLSGINRSSFFSNNIHQYTFHLTLSSKNQINLWRRQDLVKILGSESRIRKLSFHGFTNLSMETVQDILSILPHLEYIEFKYCNILNNVAVHYSLFESRGNTGITSPVTRLKLEWTDFSLKSVQGFSCFPNLTHIELGANRNTTEGANEMLITKLFEYCPHIYDMNVNLPQVNEVTISNLVIQYGSRLRFLSLNCEGPRLIKAITTHANRVSKLTLRGTRPFFTNGFELNELITKSRKLQQLDLKSFVIQDIPMTIWNHLLKHQPCIAEKAIYKIKTTILSTEERRVVGFTGLEESLSTVAREKKYDRISIRLNMSELNTINVYRQ